VQSVWLVTRLFFESDLHHVLAGLLDRAPFGPYGLILPVNRRYLTSEPYSIYNHNEYSDKY